MEHAHYLDENRNVLVTVAVTMEGGLKLRVFGDDDWIAMLGALSAQTDKECNPKTIIWRVGVENTNLYDYTLEIDVGT